MEDRTRINKQLEKVKKDKRLQGSANACLGRLARDYSVSAKVIMGAYARKLGLKDADEVRIFLEELIINQNDKGDDNGQV